MSRRGRTRILLSTVLLILVVTSLVSPASAAPDARYYRYDQIVNLFQTWESQYPNIFHREVIGYTGVGHEPIWAAKISKDAAVHDPEPVLLFHAAQHSNEPNGTQAIIFIMQRLLSRYGHDTYYTNMVNNLQMWFVPIYNIDGHRMAFGDLPDAERWRKTKRDNNGDGQYTCPEDGVDTNRNWDWRWAEDDSTNPSGEYYKGPYAFSEPEVVAMRDFILRLRPLIVMDYHSPFQHTPGNIIYWPWINDHTGQPGPDGPFYQALSIALGNHTQTENNGVYFNGNMPGYNTIPKEQNWVYANTEICVLLMEISLDNFWQGSIVDTIGARVGRGAFYVMDRALGGPGIAGQVTDAVNGRPLVAQIRVQQAYDPAIGPYLTEPDFGRYWRILSAGNYTLIIHADHHLDQTRTIQVAANGWTTEDFHLQPDGSAVAENGDSDSRILWAENPLPAGGPLRLHLPAARQASLDLLDLSGRRVMSLVDGRLVAGTRSIAIPPNLPSGVYLLRLQADGRSATTKIVTYR